MGIYVFHQGAYENGQLWYSYFDGSTWQPDKQVQGVTMSYSPSAVALPSPAGAFSVFHQGGGENGQLWYSYFDGTNWQPDKQVQNVGMSGSPSAVVVPGDGIYVFHQGFEQDGNIWYSHFHFDGSTWDPDKQVPNARIGGQGNFSASPSAIAFPDGRIAVFYQGLSHDPNPFPGSHGGNNQLWHFDGTNGDLNTQVYPAPMTFSPSAVALPAPAGAFSVFYNGIERGDGVGSGQDLFYSYFDGTNWQPYTEVQNVNMWESPSAVVVPGDGIYVFHQGPLQGGSHLGDAQQLWWSHFHFDNSTWDPDTQVMGVGMSEAPSAVVV
jgi:hypothetical protein